MELTDPNKLTDLARDPWNMEIFVLWAKDSLPSSLHKSLEEKNMSFKYSKAI